MRREAHGRLPFYAILSLLLHLSVLYAARRQLLTPVLLLQAPPPPEREEDMPRLLFVSTRPDQESDAAPAQAETYSDRQTVAAQPEPSAEPAEETAPRLDGEEPRSMATDSGQPDAGEPAPPAQEAFQPAEPAKDESPDPLESAPGGIALVMEPRPPEARAAAPAVDAGAESPGVDAPYADLPREKGLRAEATVSRRGILAHDTMKTAFGAYDRELFAAIGRRWIELVRPHFYGERSGEVVVRFEVSAAGELGRLDVVHETSGPALAGFCVKAIRDCAPFGPMPADVMKIVAADRRQFQVRFLY